MATFNCNGNSVTVGDHHPHLLSALRDELGLTAAKDGCAPSGQCGCCTVLINGKARVACQTSLEKAEGAEIITLEGVSDEERGRISSTFAAHGALQCGFCTPGIVMRTVSLLGRDKPPTRDQASRHLGGHLCRCTGYIKILDAIDDLANGVSPQAAESAGVGSRGNKYQADELSLGDRDFIDDMAPDGCLHGAVVLAAHARADVLRIDTAAALDAPGVVAVLTAADVPGELRSGIIYKDWPLFIPEGGRTSYLGDVIALVVADTRLHARDAAPLVAVDYDVHEPITNAFNALNSAESAVWELDGNVLSKSAYVRGDAQAALESSVHTVDEVFQTQRVDHTFLEPESTLAVPSLNPDGASESLHVFSGGQGVWDDRNDIARILDIDNSQVVVELVSNGGAFGGKEDMSNQGQTALAAWLLGRPVKTTFSRSESNLVNTKRHPIHIHLQAGCDGDGHLVALKVRMVGDSGPYASVGAKVLERAAGHASGPYVIDNIDVEAVAVRTNNSVCGAFRGFGANQAQFATEGAIDRLAAKVGISGWEMRSRNVISPGVIWGPGQRMDAGSAGARKCLDAVKPAFDKAVAAGRPVGVGLGLKNSGLGNGAVEVSISTVQFMADNTVEVRHCWTEMGQGVHTVARQVAVEELGIDPDRIRVLVDTSRDLGAGQTTGSRGTLMCSGSVADACRVAVAGGCEIGVEYEGRYVVDWTTELGDGSPEPIIHSTFGYAAQLVEVDPETGAVSHVVAAHDVGRAINPLLCEGQIEGAVHMGLGYALSEGFPCDEDGRPVNDTLRSLDIIRPKDMPDVDVILIEEPQPNSPYGVKGVGEIGLVPTAGAVAAALHSHDGEWRNSLPMFNESNRERPEAWV